MIRAGLAVLLGAAALGGCTQKWDTGNTSTADTRLARDVALDARRHGPEIAAFAGVKSGDKVIDLIPGGGYWTRTFARIVGPSGHVYGIWPQPYAAEAGSDVKRYAAAAGTPAFANVSASTQPATSLTAPEKVDLVFTSQNYHDYPDKFMGSIDPAVLNKAVFDALKPGGIYLIVDHQAAPGAGASVTSTLHRIESVVVKREVESAGFRLDGESDLLRHAADDHSLGVVETGIRGKTDQFILRFRKPR